MKESGDLTAAIDDVIDAAYADTSIQFATEAARKILAGDNDEW